VVDVCSPSGLSFPCAYDQVILEACLVGVCLIDVPLVDEGSVSQAAEGAGKARACQI